MNVYKLKMVKDRTVKYDVSDTIESSSDVYRLSKAMEWTHSPEEVFAIVCRKTNGDICGIFEVAKGTIDQCNVHPREVFKRALLANASSIILIHNHPSGSLTPSMDDIGLTKRLVACGKLIGVKVIDHLIVSTDGYFSFSKEDLLDEFGNVEVVSYDD